MEFLKRGYKNRGIMKLDEPGPKTIPGKEVLINLNDEAGRVWYSVEYDNDVGNWIDSFDTLEQALEFISDHCLLYDSETGFRDTRSRK